MKRSFATMLIGLAATALTACGPDKTGASTEAACTMPGLARPLRQTVVIIDQRSVVPAETAEFADRNRPLLDSVLAVADPDKAIASGAAEPRERVTILLARANGGQPDQIFTGCIPAYGPDDLARVKNGDSGLSTFVGADAVSRMKELADDYREAMLGAINKLGQMGPEPTRAAGFADSGLVRSLKSANQLASLDQGLPRLVLIAPTSLGRTGTYPDVVSARKAGFADAGRAGLDLGNAEVVVALAPGGTVQNYVTAFLLGAGGDVTSWSRGQPSKLPPAPVKVMRFAGPFRYGASTEIYPATIRIAISRNGELANSWFELRNEKRVAIPISGVMTCRDDECRFVADRRGFAHLFDPDPQGRTGVDPTLPFGGMHNIDLAVKGDRITGRVWDPIINQVGDDPNAGDFPFTLNRAED